MSEKVIKFITRMANNYDEEGTTKWQQGWAVAGTSTHCDRRVTCHGHFRKQAKGTDTPRESSGQKPETSPIADLTN